MVYFKDPIENNTIATLIQHSTYFSVYFFFRILKTIPESRAKQNMKLKSKQRQYLKGLGHSLKPVIQVGKDGLSAAVLSSISKALDDHELIKVNVLETADLDRKEASQQISSTLNAEVVQTLGRKILLFRRHQEKPKIQLPDIPDLKNTGKK